MIVSMNRLSAEKREQVIRCLVEGNSIRATVRMTGVAKNTVVKLLVDLGEACSVHQDRSMRNLPCQQVQVDEIWAFVGAKQRNVTVENAEKGWGDVWTWVALDPDTKLAVSYRVGTRDLEDARAFMQDVAGRLAHRVQLTTDGYRPYLNAVDSAFGDDVDYAQLIKIYGRTGDDRKPNRRYSPSICLGAEPTVISGSPDKTKISTSHVERQNLTMRMSMRRFTRLTNAFSKKVENLAAAVSLHFAYYNYCRVHQTLGKGVTPAMAAGVTDHVWTLSELIGLLEAAEATPTTRGPYKTTRVKRGYPADVKATEISK
jgi:IS1 family transposase